MATSEVSDNGSESPNLARSLIREIKEIDHHRPSFRLLKEAADVYSKSE